MLIRYLYKNTLLAKIFLLALLSLQYFVVFAQEGLNQKQIAQSTEKNLRGAWHLWEPYQFYKITSSGSTLTGMDIELVKTLAKKRGIEVQYEKVAWAQQQLDLKEGKQDIASGATYTKARAEYAYFSVPYRFEENALFVSRNSNKNLKFQSIPKFLEEIKVQNFRLGVSEGFVYADPRINLFINDYKNKQYITVFPSALKATQALIKGEIDGFIQDRIVGAAAVLKEGATKDTKEILLNIKTPIHLMFSKKTVPIELVEQFNKTIKEFAYSKDYKDIVKTYLYPAMLLHTIDSRWFSLMTTLGIFAFGIAGISMAAKDNATLFGTIFFAMLPSIGGRIMRDILTSQEKISIFEKPLFMYYVILLATIGFFSLKIMYKYNKKINANSIIASCLDNTLVIFECMGHAAFLVLGVCVAVIAGLEPAPLWGGFFAFITAHSGTIMRNLLRKKHYMVTFSKTIFHEISITWGIIFAIFLDSMSYDPNPSDIENTVIMIVLGAFLTSTASYYLKLENIRFRPKEEDIIDK